MIFTSIKFVIFLTIFLLIYFITPDKIKKFIVLIASYIFCAFWSFRSVLYLVTITIITYIAARLICKKHKIRKIILFMTISAIVICLLVLKYSNFIIDVVNNISFKIGFNQTFNSINVIAPLGISFYTLQAIGYLIDVYRDETALENNIINYALFIAFFPLVSSGPIERSNNLLKQIKEKSKKPQYRDVTNAFIMILYGFFLKMVIADRLSILVDNVYNNYYMYHSYELFIGAAAYSIQLYCDFCSYSIIAVGIAQAFGYKIIDNFDTPYFSTSIKEFWRRWHISLSSWLRDYIYIPLGGSRCSKLKKYYNLMVTFLISGLWHGANWTFVVWGGIHGLYQVVGDFTHKLRERLQKNVNKSCFSYKLGQIVITNALVSFAWIFFRADSIKTAWSYVNRMVTRLNPWDIFSDSIYSLGLDRTEINIIFISLLFVLLVDAIKYKKKCNLAQVLEKQNLWFRWCVIFTLLFMIIIFGEYGAMFDAKSFVYFQF